MIRKAIDSYFKRLFKTEQLKDGMEKTTVKTAREYKGIGWWLLVQSKKERWEVRRLKGQSKTLVGANTREHENLARDILGPYWASDVAKYPDADTWIHHKREAIANISAQHGLAQDPKHTNAQRQRDKKTKESGNLKSPHGKQAPAKREKIERKTKTEL